MKIPAYPEDEESRLEVLSNLGIVYSPAEERFDRITRLARRVFEVPIALVSIVTANTQWFKSCQGLGTAETSRKISFCGHAILIDDPLVIIDTYENPDFADNPLVTGEPFIRFYAGQAINFDGKKIGTLCIIDTKPHVFFPSDIDTLCSLACWAENELKLSAHDKIQKKLIGERDELERKAMIDPLTGTWNWQGLMEIFKPAFARAKRTKTIITLMKVHVDKVRYVTDSNLHEAEDMVLQEVVQRIRSSLRPHDLIGRHKDNEFLIFLADCNKDSAEMISQRMLRNVNIEPITAKDGRVMATLSIGMACNEDIGLWNWNDLIKIAESALFDVIVDGGNQSILRSNA